MSNDIPRSLETLINGYEIKFILKNSTLHIEAENTSTSKLYLVNISQCETDQLTEGHFSDLESLYDSLIEGINEIESSINLTMSDYDKLVLKKEKAFKFSITLKEKEQNHITILQRNNEKLKTMIRQKDQKIYQLQRLSNRQSSDNLKYNEILELSVEKQSLKLESKRSSQIEKQVKIESSIEKQSLTLESKKSSQLENPFEKAELAIENQNPSEIENQIRIRVDLAMEKESQILKKLLSEYNEMTKAGIETEFGKQTQTIKTLLSDHFINNKINLMSTELKHNIIASENILPPQIIIAPENNVPPQIIKPIIINKMILQFDVKSVNSDTFYFFNKNQTIICKDNCNFWRMIYLNKSLPRSKISYNFRIEKSKSNLIMIGICPISIMNNTGACFDNSVGAYAYYLYDGRIFFNKTEIKSKGGVFIVGSIIRMTVNLLDATIEWMQDNKMMHRMNLEKSSVSQEMYACLHFYHEGDSVSLLNN